MIPDTAPGTAVSQPARSAGPDICVIVNAGSGKRRGTAAARELAACFERFPGRFELRLVRRGTGIEAAAERAVGEGFETIVAAGGDGTICAVAGVLAGSGRRLGVLPLGTFNYFARTLDMPEELAAAVAVLAGGHTRPVGFGEVNGRPFLNNASLGTYAWILERREQVYRRWGRSRLATYWAVLTTLVRFYRPLTLRISVDGEVRRARSPLAFVACNPVQLDMLGLEGAGCVRDGRFALFIAPDCGRLALLRYAVRLAFGRVEPGRDVELVCGREIVVETPRRRRRLVARDGERERMNGPFRFRLHVDALRVVVPAEPG